MIGNLKLILSVYIVFMGIITTECQVTVNNLNGNGNFLCGYTTKLECVISDYGGGMTWKLDGTIIAQCAFQSCTALGALPSGDIFTPDEDNGKFNLTIGITHADNGTMYQCDDGSAQDQTTVNIQVPPNGAAFTPNITETTKSITVEAGCFYPSDAGRMDVYEVNSDGNEMMVETKNMTPTTTGCTGDCAGPNIYTATGNITLDSSNMGGNSRYRFEVYHKDFKQYAISSVSSPIYNFDGCKCKLPFPCVVIVCDIVAFILVIIFCWLNKGPFSDKIRCYIAGIAVVICLVLVISVTIYLFVGCNKCCADPCHIALTVVVWILIVFDAAFYIIFLVKSKQLEWLSCGLCQVEPSCETKHAREPQHSNQPGKDKFARNGNNDKGRENASRTNAPRPQPAPPMKDPSPLPGITKDKASRGLSATFDDQFDHMPSFESKNKLQPLQPNSITEEDEQKKKKKKKKRKNDETM